MADGPVMVLDEVEAESDGETYLFSMQAVVDLMDEEDAGSTAGAAANTGDVIIDFVNISDEGTLVDENIMALTSTVNSTQAVYDSSHVHSHTSSGNLLCHL